MDRSRVFNVHNLDEQRKSNVSVNHLTKVAFQLCAKVDIGD